MQWPSYKGVPKSKRLWGNGRQNITAEQLFGGQWIQRYETYQLNEKL